MHKDKKADQKQTWNDLNYLNFYHNNLHKTGQESKEKKKHLNLNI